jgi:hypothetical protein
MLLYLFNEHRADVQHIASVLLALAIWRWGRGPERWLIGLFIVTMVMPPYVFKLFGLGNVAFGPFAWIWIGIDVFATVAFTAIAVNANRNYPLWIAGFQLVAMGAHVVRGLVDTVSVFAYVVLSAGPAYCQLVLIFAGFLRHVGRERRFGAYREWRIARERFALFQH